MTRFISGTFILALFAALAAALYLALSAYYMPMDARLSCYDGASNTVTCKTALILDAASKNQ